MRDTGIATIDPTKNLDCRDIFRRRWLLSVISGTVVLTREGDRKDYVVTAGHELEFRPRGRTILRALSDTAVVESRRATQDCCTDHSFLPLDGAVS